MAPPLITLLTDYGLQDDFVGICHGVIASICPEISIVIFDSTAPKGAGQAVYLSATAEQVPDDDLDRALAVYPGSAEGAARDNREQLQAPGPYRLYRATAYEWSILCPRDTALGGTGACTPHGVPFDHRVQVQVAD